MDVPSSMSARVQKPHVSERPASSVGDNLESNQIYSTQHPAYQSFAAAVNEQLAVLANREAERRATARTLLLPYQLTSDEVAALRDVYPEFRVTCVPVSKPVHLYWTALRAASNEWMAVNVAKYGDSPVHYGGSRLSSMVAGRSGVHLETSDCDPSAVHSTYADTLAALRIFTDPVTVAKEYGVPLNVDQYDAYCSGRAYGVCVDAGACTHQAKTMCADLASADISPEQVAMAMAQHGAEVCYGYYVYDPAMLVQQRGEFAQTGVSFEWSDNHVSFLYPEGVSGVWGYRRDTWAKWCVSHYFPVGSQKDQWYQLELLKQRGPFMMFRMVKVEKPESSVVLSHALDYSNADDYTLVKSWRLVRGLATDMTLPDCWEANDFLVRSRVVRRVYEFAMQLQPEVFTRFAIKKQVRVINNRWVVQGTVVAVAAAIEPAQVESLTTAVYARAFVDRFDSAQLSGQMMRSLMSLNAFTGASAAVRVAMVAGAACTRLYLTTFGVVDALVRATADHVVDYLTPRPSARGISMDRAPTYLPLTTQVGQWMTRFWKCGEQLVGESDARLGIVVQPRAPGGVLAAAARHYTRERPGSLSSDLRSVVRVVTDIVDVSLGATDVAYQSFADQVSRLNELDSVTSKREHLEMETAERQGGEIQQAFRNGGHPDPVFALNQLYADTLPNMARTEVQYDTFSLSLDPQDRTLAAPYLRMPTYFGLPPAPRQYYVSRLNALSVPKRQNTSQELLSAMAARNMAAPAISLAQDDDVIIAGIWNQFLDTACVADARAKLAEYQADPAALAEGTLRDWASKARPEAVERLKKEMEDVSTALGDRPVHEYLAMIKADVKPTMSEKPVHEVTAPQVIVYHDKLLSALYSSIFRLLVRRFLSLLKSNYHINLLKDTKDIQQFITSNHPFSEVGLQYLENDFSKYDKSQSEFVFRLENYVFQQLGMNLEALDQWMIGHVDCSIRSVSLGLSLHVLYQRKSGDATTAFGNVLLNVLSVSYAYAGTEVVWAVFMGDDSIVCARKVVSGEMSVRILAEVFNLIAKYYVTDSPYFASNFILIDEGRMQVRLAPDPIKRVERLSMHVSADDPQWEERWNSLQDSMAVYLDSAVCQQIARAVPLRYDVAEGFVRDAAVALGTLVLDYGKFRSLWSDQPEDLRG